MGIIFDASALLVLLNKEPGHETVESHLTHAIMSAVNLAEAITVLTNIGIPVDNAVQLASELITEIVSFDAEQAAITAELRSITKPFGLSLGDRACLALAKSRQLPVITADKIWKALKLPIDIKVVR